MRCPKCKTGVTSRELKCSGCGLMTPYGRHVATLPAEDDAPQWQQDLKRLNSKPVRLSRRALIGVLAATVFLCGGASYWYSARRESSEQLPDPKEEAVMLVMKADCAQGGTIDDRLGKIIEDLSRKQTLEELPGWSAMPANGQMYRVFFIYKENDNPEQTFEWRVNLRQRTVQPDNILARHITE